MQTVAIKDSQKVHVVAVPMTAAMSNATNFNPAMWTVDNPAVVTVMNITNEGLEADVVAQGIGTALITVTGQQGNFQPNYSTSFTVTVTADVPTQFVFTFGSPVPKG